MQYDIEKVVSYNNTDYKYENYNLINSAANFGWKIINVRILFS